MKTQKHYSKSCLNSTKYDNRKASIPGKKNFLFSSKLAILFIISILFYCNYTLASTNSPYIFNASGGGSISLVEDWLVSNSSSGDIILIDVYDANSQLQGSYSGCMEIKCTDDFSTYADGIYFVIVTTTTGKFSGTIIK